MTLRPHKWADQQTAAPRKLQALLHVLAGFANGAGVAYPSQATIARRIGWSKGTIKKWTDVGRALALFSVRKRFNHSKGHVDGMFYTLHLGRVVTAEDVAKQIADSRLRSIEINRKNGNFPPAKANRKNGRGKSQLAANNSKNSMEEPTKTMAVDAQPSPKRSATPLPPKASAGRDWLLVSDPERSA